MSLSMAKNQRTSDQISDILARENAIIGCQLTSLEASSHQRTGNRSGIQTTPFSFPLLVLPPTIFPPLLILNPSIGYRLAPSANH